MSSRQVVANNLIIEPWTVLDLAFPPGTVTGITSPAGITFVLQRESGSAIVAASEVISWTEIGATGRYYFSFTPVNSGLYIVYGQEVSLATLRRAFEFRYEVLAAGAEFSPTYANAFCAESDIERWIQQAITASTKPNDTETAGFAEARAARLMALMAGLGFTVTPATVTAGSRLEDLLREANAIGAAIDYTIAQQFANRPNLSERVERLQMLWLEFYGDVLAGKPGIIESEVTGNLVSLASCHTLSGDTIPRVDSPQFEAPIGIGMGDTF